MSWVAYLRTQLPTLVFRAATAFLPSTLDLFPSVVKNKSKEQLPVDDGVGIETVLECLSHWARGKGGDKLLTVGVVGLTNVRFDPYYQRRHAEEQFDSYSVRQEFVPEHAASQACTARILTGVGI